MTCLRCDGLMVHEKLKILTDSGRVIMSLPDGVASTVGQLSIP